MGWDRGWRHFSVTFGRDRTEDVVIATVFQMEDDLPSVVVNGYEGQITVGLADTVAERAAEVLVRVAPDLGAEPSAEDAEWLEDRTWPATVPEEFWRDGRYCPLVVAWVGTERVWAKTHDGQRVSMTPVSDDDGRYGRWLGQCRPVLTSYPAVVAAWRIFCSGEPLPSRIRIRLLHNRWNSHDMDLTTTSEPFTSLVRATTSLV